MIRIEKRLAIWLTFFVGIIDTKTRRLVSYQTVEQS